jgi:hypothetical protein
VLMVVAQNISQFARGYDKAAPLTPYLFLITEEVLNQCIKSEIQQGRIQGIQLPSSTEQQTILQYADDTSLTLRGEEQVVKQTVATLSTFSFG